MFVLLTNSLKHYQQLTSQPTKEKLPKPWSMISRKKYKALEIPYPKDTVQAELAAEEAKQKAAYEKFVSESQTRVAGITTELAKWEAMMPIEEMNLEEAMIAVPHLVPQHRLDGVKNFWPFDRDFEEWKKDLDQVKLEYNEEHSMDPDAKGH